MLCIGEITFTSMAHFDGWRKNNVQQCSFLEYDRGPMNKVFVGTLAHVGGTCYIDMHPQNLAVHVINDTNSSSKSCA